MVCGALFFRESPKNLPLSAGGLYERVGGDLRGVCDRMLVRHFVVGLNGCGGGGEKIRRR